MSGEYVSRLQWLEGEAGLELLRYCARRVLSQLPEGMYGPRNHPDTIYEVSHDLWIFVHTLSSAKRQDLAVLAEQGQSTKLAAVLIRLYICSCLDQRRTSAFSPWHALYRRMRSLLSRTPGIIYASEPTQTWFAWTSKPPAAKELLADSDFTTWSPPPVQSKDLSLSANLQEAARFFWTQAVQFTGRPCLVSVRSLVTYIGAHYPEQVRTPIVHAHDPARPEIPEGETGMRGPEQKGSFSPEHTITAHRLPELAAGFAAGLSDMELTLWLLRFDHEFGWKEIAHELGLNNPSGAYYHYAKLEKRFKLLCLQWPGLSPEDSNQELAVNFLDAVLEACKDRIQDREEK